MKWAIVRRSAVARLPVAASLAPLRAVESVAIGFELGIGYAITGRHMVTATLTSILTSDWALMVPNFTGRVVRRCAAFQIAVYCSVPRPTGPTRSGIMRVSSTSCRMWPGLCGNPALPPAR